MKYSLITAALLATSTGLSATENARLDEYHALHSNHAMHQDVAETTAATEAPLMLAAADTGAATGGTTHTITTQVTKFVPMVLFIEPGDTVTWTNMAGHDATSIEGMIPEGAEGWQSKMGETYSHTFTVPGAYVYKCNPHASMGMIGSIVVGERQPANLASIEANPENKGMVGRAVRMLKQKLAE